MLFIYGTLLANTTFFRIRIKRLTCVILIFMCLPENKIQNNIWCLHIPFLEFECLLLFCFFLATCLFLINLLPLEITTYIRVAWKNIEDNNIWRWWKTFWLSQRRNGGWEFCGIQSQVLLFYTFRNSGVLHFEAFTYPEII